MQVRPCNSLAAKEPDVLQFLDHGKNARIDPNSLGPASERKAWWRHVCPLTAKEHSWEAAVIYLLRTFRHTRKAPCPVCSKGANKQRLIKVNMGTRLPKPI